jgi:hypothetical protein
MGKKGGSRKKAGMPSAKPAIGSAAKRRREALKAGKPQLQVQRPKGAIGKRVPDAPQYMTRDAARRLRLAKGAAAEVLAAGGGIAAAALAAQAFGSDPGGSDSDSGGDGCGVERAIMAVSIADAPPEPEPELSSGETE